MGWLLEMKKIFDICKIYFITHKNAVILHALLCVLLSLQSLATPYITGNFIDVLVIGSDLHGILNYCCIYTIITLISLIIGYICNRLYIKLQTTMSFELNRDVLIHLQKIPVSYYFEQDKTSLNQKINNDVNALITFCISLFQNLITNLLTVLLAILIISFFDIKISGILLILIPCYYLVYKKFKSILFKNGYELKKSQTEYFGKLFEQISYIKQIKIFSLFSSFINRLNNAFNNTINNAYKYQNASYIFSSLDTTILSLAQIFLFIYGGLKVIGGEISIGNFTIISSYFGMMLSSVRYFFSLGKNVQDVMVSYERLYELINIKSESVGLIRLESVDKIQIKNASLVSENKNIISDFNVTFVKGSIYVINGDNGSGKSTLINLILGLFIDEFNGDIFFNSISIKDIDMYYLRQKCIGITEQEPILFEDSIMYNIFLGENKDKSNGLSNLIDILNFTDFLKALPNGIETKVCEKAATFSGGEKQKIALLRALIKDSDVLLLDEPTSALDSISSERLMNYLRTIKNNKIIIIVTHDKLFFDIADDIIYIDENNYIIDK